MFEEYVILLVGVSIVVILKVERKGVLKLGKFKEK